MHLVAITRLADARGLEQDLPQLAVLLRLSAYDTRLRLAGPLPIIAASGLDLSETQVVLAALRARGYGAVACEARSVPEQDRCIIARTFEFGAEAISGGGELGHRFALPYAEIIGVLRAVETSSDTATKQTVKKQLSLGRAALTAGLMTKKQTTTTSTSTSYDHQQVAFVFRRSAPEPLVFKERQLQYQGLGQQRGRTTLECFAQLCELLRRGAPGAICDDRLLAAKRRPELRSVQGGARERVISNSNGAANLLAAYLLMYAHLQGQA
jgi:hypothetical protein